MRHAKFASLAILIIAALLAGSDEVAAQTPSGCSVENGNNVLDCVLDTFRNATRTWEASLAQLALRLFWILALIEFTWAAIQLAFRGADLGEWLAALLNQIMFIGFFAALLQFSAEWAGAIVASFREAANIAGGVSVIRPSDLFDVGVKLGSALISDLSVLNLAFSLVLIVATWSGEPHAGTPRITTTEVGLSPSGRVTVQVGYEAPGVPGGSRFLLEVSLHDDFRLPLLQERVVAPQIAGTHLLQFPKPAAHEAFVRAVVMSAADHVQAKSAAVSFAIEE